MPDAREDLTIGLGSSAGWGVSIVGKNLINRVIRTYGAALPTSDVEHVASAMRHAQVRTLESHYGHIATTLPPGMPEFAFFDSQTRAFLDSFS
jgi:hypothetical protein